jgi:ankyrin repeat protein
MKFITGLLQLIKYKFKRGASKMEPMTENSPSEAEDDLERTPSEEHADVDTIDTSPASGALKLRKHLKIALVAAVLTTLAMSIPAVLRFIFSKQEISEQQEAFEQRDDETPQTTRFELSSLDRALIRAVREGDINEVRLCLAEGAGVGAVDELGATPFRAAIALNRVEMVREFIAAGHGNANDKENSLLVYAVVQNRPEIVRELMKLSPDVNAIDRNGFTPLLYAVDRNNVNVVKELLSAGADANAKGRGGISPLIAAVTVARPDTVAELLKAGADRNVLSPSGETAVSIARKRSQQAMIALLTGADVLY